MPLAVATRSGVPDTLHRGSAVAVDDTGHILLELGDRATRAYIRSAAKPIQCLPVLLSGAAEAFGLDDADLAIICGSHRGGAPQVAQVRSILHKCGLDESRLRSGSGVRDNCSGKHAGMLATCVHLGLRLDDYTRPDHPHQVAVLETLKQICRLTDREVHVGVDGCSAAIHHFTIEKMASGYARMSMPRTHFEPPTAAAVERITSTMWTAPDGHTGEPLYRSVLGASPRLLVKAGGNGVYCAGVVGRGVGFALKIEDGAPLPVRHVFVELMQRLGVFSDGEAGSVRSELLPRVENRRGDVVGNVELLI
jgi:L-asparaginase II